jgi:hypothetical protein
MIIIKKCAVDYGAFLDSQNFQQCHPERSEGSLTEKYETLRSRKALPQSDILCLSHLPRNIRFRQFLFGHRKHHLRW